MLWKDDDELFSLVRKELFTALVGDVLDGHGLYHQFLPQEVKPLDEDMVVIGRAMPVLEADAYEVGSSCSSSELLTKPFGLMFQALDDLRENEVYVASGSSFDYAMWGGMMTARARVLKANGAVLNGFSRDTPDVRRQGFPCFSRGTYAQDQGVRGKVIGWRVPIRFGDVTVNPGDIIYGDLDGVVVVPREIENEIFMEALEKSRKENLLREAVDEGMSSVDAFERFGIF